jgi:23S rRNA pseudouridine2604 synthase
MRTPAPKPQERLSKRVMQLKGCSRTEAEHYIHGGFVSVNGTVVEEPAHRVSQHTVTIDPQASLLLLTSVTLLLNKPPGATDGLEENPHPTNGRSLLTPAHHWAQDPAELRVLKRHFHGLHADVALETGASGLTIFTQDWRTTRKLTEDMAVMEHEYLVEVQGEMSADALKPIGYALKDERKNLPQVKVSVSSSTPAMSRLRFAIKGAHPGLIAYLCEQAGLRIVAMRRTRIGRVNLGDVPVGQWRYLAEYEKF